MTDQSPETPQVAAAAVSRRLATESDLAHARTLLQPDEAILWTIKTDPQQFKNQAIFFGVFGIPIVLSRTSLLLLLPGASCCSLLL